jgi:uncharacterized membrane protein
MSGRLAVSFAVLAYPTKERATDALALITELSKTEALTLRDAAVVVHTSEDRVEVEQARELSAGAGAVAGGVAGLLRWRWRPRCARYRHR